MGVGANVVAGVSRHATLLSTHDSGAAFPPVQRLPAGQVVPLAPLPPGQYCVAGQSTLGVTMPLEGQRYPGVQGRQPLSAGVIVVLINVDGGHGVGELLPSCKER
jgi:hypothetical protein